MGWQYILIAVLFLSFAGYFLGKKKSVQSTSVTNDTVLSDILTELKDINKKLNND